jgi:hypothetical protein
LRRALVPGQGGEHSQRGDEEAAPPREAIQDGDSIGPGVIAREAKSSREHRRDYEGNSTHRGQFPFATEGEGNWRSVGAWNGLRSFPIKKRLTTRSSVRKRLVATVPPGRSNTNVVVYEAPGGSSLVMGVEAIPDAARVASMSSTG